MHFSVSRAICNRDNMPHPKLYTCGKNCLLFLLLQKLKWRIKGIRHALKQSLFLTFCCCCYFVLFFFAGLFVWLFCSYFLTFYFFVFVCLFVCFPFLLQTVLDDHPIHISIHLTNLPPTLSCPLCFHYCISRMLVYYLFTL